MNKKSALPLSLLALAALAHAQEQLPLVSVTGQGANAPVSLSGFGNTPAARLPLQALRIDGERLQDLGLQGLGKLPSLDASISDSYNSLGYIGQFKVRGFDLDTRFNLRRDGLPMNGESVFSLFNKGALEVLKGSSGMQAGTSSPAGLLNLVVKRPDADRLDLALGWESHDSRSIAVDWSQRFGPAKAFGLRINAAAARLDPWLHDSEGRQRAFALASDWRVSKDTLVEFELEHSTHKQPSQPGFSLLGSRLPSIDEIDRRRNLNDSAWREPGQFDSDFASLRLRQRLEGDWWLTVHAGHQRSVNDDRVAFPFGCSAEDNYASYCSDGSFDVYDYRSENERRTTDSLRAAVEGSVQFIGLKHQLRAELLGSRYQSRLQRQAYNWAGTGSVFGGGSSSADPTLTDENTNRDERSTELGLSDQVQIGALELFGGLRHTRLHRESVRTDGSRATDYSQSFTTPWLGASWLLAQDLRVYASLGQGIESEVVPNRSRYLRAGQSLPALRSRQAEIGLKAGSKTVDWSLAAFDVQRPVWRDIGACNSAVGSCQRVEDGEARHRGVEAQADLKWTGGGLLASGMRLKARRQDSADASLNGLRPTNVPKDSLKLALRQQVWQGLQLQGAVVHEGARAVLPDNRLNLAGWTRVDLGAKLTHAVGSQTWTWRAGVENAFDKKAWKESPYTFDHVYLYPLAPRTWTASLNISL